MSEIKLEVVDSIKAEMMARQSWKPVERRKEYDESRTVTARGLVQMAIAVGAMEMAGDDVSDIPSSSRAFMAKLRSGQMLPEVYIQFAGTTRHAVSMLPLADQKKLADGTPVSMVVRRDAKTEILMVDPRRLSGMQLKQVFSRGYIRDEAEQVAWMADQDRRAGSKKGRPDVEIVGNKGIRVGKHFISKKELARYLADLES